MQHGAVQYSAVHSPALHHTEAGLNVAAMRRVVTVAPSTLYTIVVARSVLVSMNKALVAP